MKHAPAISQNGFLDLLKRPFQFFTATEPDVANKVGNKELSRNTAPFFSGTTLPRSYIESYGTYLPQTTVSSHKTAKAVTQVKFIPLRYVTGIKKRRVTSTLSAYDLAALAMEKCLSRSRYLPEDIDLIINCNICKSSADGKEIYYEPTTAMKLRHAFNLTNAICFDINNACAGMFTAIHIANHLIADGSIRRALIVSGERISHLTETAQREIRDLRDPRLACLTLGDAGAALLLDATSDPSYGIVHSTMKTLTEHSKLCVAFPTKESHGGIIMHTQSKKLTMAGRSESAKYLFEQTAQNKMQFCRNTLIITHQVSKGLPPQFVKTINELSGSKRLRNSQMFNNVANVGNTASTAHIVAFAKAIASKRLKKEDEVIFVTQASGLVIGLLHYKLDNLPVKISSLKKRKNIQITESPSAPETTPNRCDKPRIMINKITSSREQPIDTVAMAANATARCMKLGQIENDEISYLIHAGQYRSDHVEEPSHAALIAGHVKLSHGDILQPLLTFDITNAGLGWLNAVHVAATLIDPDQTPNIVITASECDENKKSSLGQPLNVSELATATLLKPSNGISGFSNFHFRFFTADIGLRDVKFLASGASSCHVKTECPSFEDKLANAVSETVRDQLKALDASLDDFAAVIIPQRSHRFLQKVADLLQLPPTKLIDISCDTDHFSNSIPLALEMIVDNRSYKHGDRVLIVDAAPGIQVGMAIYIV